MVEFALIAVIAALGLLSLAHVSLRFLPRPAAIVAVGALVIAGIAWPASRFAKVSQEPLAPADLSDVAYVRSEGCAVCHPAHVESWAATYHRTMTQEPSHSAVLGDFSDVRIAIDGTVASMTTNGADYVMNIVEVPNTEGGSIHSLGVGRYRIDRLVGSHEIQVYLTLRPDGSYQTLPFEWNARDQRWVSSAGNFLQPPSAAPTPNIAADWNNNCSFCHNTRVTPGWTGIGPAAFANSAVNRSALAEPADAPRFETRVEELGIACEACHAPGAEHAGRNRNPVRRAQLKLTGRADPSIINPDRLDARESVEVCGRCHGKWFPRASLQHQMLTEGELYVPAQNPLVAHFEDPLMRASRGDDAAGFLWPDQTPRPTSMEYQGVVLSSCFVRGEMTCRSCHSMHDAPADDQLRFLDDPETPESESDRMCTQCHTDLEMTSARNEHSHHRESLACVDCHMPYQSYGLMKAVRSHRVTSPDPHKTAAFGLPNACTQCHVTKSLDWASGYLRVWASSDLEGPPPEALLDESLIPSTVRELVAGNALTRALAADALGRLAAEKNEVEWRYSALIDALDDDYAAVRYQAAESLQALSNEPIVFDYLAPQEQREVQARALREQLTATTLPPGTTPDDLKRLRSARDETPVTVLE